MLALSQCLPEQQQLLSNLARSRRQHARRLRRSLFRQKRPTSFELTQSGTQPRRVTHTPSLFSNAVRIVLGVPKKESAVGAPRQEAWPCRCCASCQTACCPIYPSPHSLTAPCLTVARTCSAASQAYRDAARRQLLFPSACSLPLWRSLPVTMPPPSRSAAYCWTLRLSMRTPFTAGSEHPPLPLIPLCGRHLDRVVLNTKQCRRAISWTQRIVLQSA